MLVVTMGSSMLLAVLDIIEVREGVRSMRSRGSEEVLAVTGLLVAHVTVDCSCHFVAEMN